MIEIIMSSSMSLCKGVIHSSQEDTDEIENTNFSNDDDDSEDSDD